MAGMPSARGMEWKGRETKEARENWYRNFDRIFGKKKPLLIYKCFSPENNGCKDLEIIGCEWICNRDIKIKCKCRSKRGYKTE